MNSNNYKINAIDALRVVFSIGVMAIHTELLHSMDFLRGRYYITQVIFRMGVPFFFVTSGFFYARTIEDSSKSKREDICLNYIKRMSLPLITWSLLALIWDVYDGAKGSITMGTKMIHDSFFYPLGAMWYILACIIAAAIITVLYEEEKILICLAIPLYVFALLANTYYFLIESTWFKNVIDSYMEYFVSARNGMFVGLPLFGTGVFIYRHRDVLLRFRKHLYVIVGLAVFFIYLLEVMICRGRNSIDDTALYFSTPLAAAILFIVALISQPRLLKDIRINFRKMSKYIFFLHPFFNRYLGAVLYEKTGHNGIIQFCYVGGLCLLAMVIIEKLNIKPVKKLVLVDH